MKFSPLHIVCSQVIFLEGLAMRHLGKLLIFVGDSTYNIATNSPRTPREQWSITVPMALTDENWRRISIKSKERAKSHARAYHKFYPSSRD